MLVARVVVVRIPVVVHIAEVLSRVVTITSQNVFTTVLSKFDYRFF